jgi:hypothetical protein
MENQFEVVWPSGKLGVKKGTLAQKLETLEGKTILELSHYSYRGDDIFPILRESLKKQYKNIKIIDYDQWGNFRDWRKYGAELEKYDGLADLLKKDKVDAVIIGIGACGACTPAVTRTAAAIEKCGVPTASIVITGFLSQGKLVGKSQGLPGIGLAEYPGTMMTDNMDQLTDKVNNILFKNVVKCLTTAEVSTDEKEEPAADEPGMRDIVFKGDIIEVNDYYYDNLWTDGLPIIPPVIKEIEKFLTYTSRKPEEVISVLMHENREATIWNIAVNGVMAGCRPEYMPILIAIVEAISVPVYRVQDTGITPGIEPLIIINGPIIKDLDFNFGQGVMRIGRRPNSSIGRFLKLFLRNICGFRLPPGVGDKGSIGQNFNVVLAENEDAVQEMGWQPYSVDRGFSTGDNIITVMSSNSMSSPAYSAGSTAKEHLETLNEILGQRFIATFSTFAAHGLDYQPLIMLSPAVAQILAKDGYTKDAVKEYFFKNIRVTAAWIEKYVFDFHGVYLNMYEKVQQGLLPAEYGVSKDPQRLVRPFPEPKSLQIVVSGDPARNQSRAFIENGFVGIPTSKKIVLPEDWQRRLKEHS